MKANKDKGTSVGFTEITPERYDGKLLDKSVADELGQWQEPKIKGCNMCGGKLVEIRGRYPNQPKRLICPTCAYEKLEQINDLSSPNYGQTNQNTPT